jgi:ribonuclease P protein component
MLQRKNRLSAEKDLSRLFRKGRLFHGTVLSARVLRNSGEATRVAFVVSTKVSKRATTRNLVKRRLREAVRASLGELQPGWDIVIIVRPQAADIAGTTVSKVLDEVLRKAKVFKA